MVRPVTVSVAGVGASQVVPVDSYVTPFSLAVGCKAIGYVVYSVEHTYDNVFREGFNPKTASWYRAPSDALTGATSSAFGGYTAPVSALRLRVLAGDGAVEMSVIHGGIYQEDPSPRRPMLPPDMQPLGYIPPDPIESVESEPPQVSLWTRVLDFFRRWV